MLALTLALTLAHPPYEVEKNASEVVHAASVIMHDINASLNSSVGQWEILSSRKQLVSGFNYFLVFGVEVAERVRREVLPDTMFSAAS